MLTFYGTKTKGPISVDVASGSVPPHIVWIDAFEPSDGEMAFLRGVMGVRIPTKADLVEIESSSRLSSDDRALLISLPATVRDEHGYPNATPIGFVIVPERVTTIRFAHLPSFEHLAGQICAKGDLGEGGMGATVTIVEIVVDHLADLLEHVSDDLDTMSRRIFANGVATRAKKRPRTINRSLSGLLAAIGRNGDLISRVNESLLSLGRIPPFLASKGTDLMTPELKGRLETIGADAKSLHEFQDHLANKAQFMLDALLGLANIEQNNVFRVLTVVSVIGIPPTFFASLYGMNFKTMPELDWAYGYTYGLTLIVLSALVPAVWFKVKGWW